MNLLDKFNEFEEKYNLYEKDINGYKYWIPIRFKIFNGIISSYKLNLGAAHPFKKDSKINLIKKGLKIIKNSVLKNPLQLKYKDYDILVVPHPRKNLIEDKHICIYTDQILERLNKKYKCCVLDRTYNLEHFNDSYTGDQVMYTDYFVLLSIISRIKEKIIPNKIFKNNTRSSLIKICNNINYEFNLNISHDDFIKLIIDSKNDIEIRLKYYEKILSGKKPKLIIQVCSYDKDCFSMNYVAHSLGIPVIELQHGNIDSNHSAYNFSNQLNKSEYLPDYLFTFGKYYDKNIKFPIDDKNIVTVGFPYLESKINNIEHKDNNIEKEIVLIISQGIVGKYLVDFAVELDKNIFTNKRNMEIIYKLHPSEYSNWTNMYPELMSRENIKVIDNNEISLYEYFKISNYQIGVQSTAILEGIAFGLKTFIFETSISNSYKDLIDKNMVKKIANVNEFLDEIHNNDNFNLDIDFIWEKNSIQKILNSIDSIIN